MGERTVRPDMADIVGGIDTMYPGAGLDLSRSILGTCARVRHRIGGGDVGTLWNKACFLKHGCLLASAFYIVSAAILISNFREYKILL